MNFNTHRGFVLIGATLFGTVFSAVFGILIYRTLNALPTSLFMGIVVLAFSGSLAIVEIMWVVYFKKLSNLKKKE